MTFKQLLTHTDFTGIDLSPSAIVKPNPLPQHQAGAMQGPGFDSAPYTGLQLPINNSTQYNVNYWSVIQCGNNKASLWLNGWGYYLPKDTPTNKLSGYHLAIGGGRAANLPTVWDSHQHYLQINYVETIYTSYHVNHALTQQYLSMFLYCPTYAGYPAKSLNFTIPTWASEDNGYFNETIAFDWNTPGVGVYASSPLRSTSRYIQPWAGGITFGNNNLRVPRLIGLNINYANMQFLLLDYCTAANLPLEYYGNPSNWRFDGVSLQIETMWPDEYRPPEGGPIPGQCGVMYEGVEVNVFQRT